MNRNRRIARVAASATSVVLGAVPAASAGLVALEQERSVSAFVIVPQCQDTDADSQSAPGFDLFDAAVGASVICDLAQGIASADQVSEIGVALITASGSAASEAVAVMPNVIHAIAHSAFEVTFNLSEESPFSAEALLSADSSDAPIIVLSGATFSLSGPGGAMVFSHELEPGPGGEPMSALFVESGTLARGGYILRVQCASVIDNRVPPARSGDTSFDMTFQLGSPCTGDTNGDGAVDVTDLVNVVLAWGSADPQADVNNDGVVDVADLVEVTLAWGFCPG